MRAAKIITSFLILFCMGAGVWMMVQGGRETAQRQEQIQNYEETVGYCVDWVQYNTTHSHGKTKTTYSEVYQYEVDGQTYTVKTDYGSNMLAPYGTEKTVYYNPKDPAEATLSGANRPSGLIWGGLFFVAVPLVFVVAFLALTGVFGRFADNILDLVVGIVTLIVALAFSYFMSGSLSPVELWKAVGPLALFPLMFFAVSLLMFKRALFGRPKWMKEGQK